MANDTISYEDAFKVSAPQSPKGAAAAPISYEDAFGLKPAEPVGRSAADYVRDAAAWAAKGAVAVPEAVVGLADIATGGRAGKLLENEGGAVGFRPKQAREAINEWHSDATKEAQRKFQEAEGLGGKLQAAIENPSNIVGAVVESLPAMGAGGVVARGLGAATRLGHAGAKGAAAAGALGEGIVGAGSAAEQIRQESEDGLLSPGQTAAAAATGAATAGLGYAGGRVAQRLGIGDAETMLAQGNKGIAKQFADDAATAATNPLVQQRAVKSIPTQVIQGAISEGFLEELPQSVAEQIFQNLALGKDWSEDVDTAVVLGTLSGAAMGGGAAGYRAAREPRVPAGQPGEAAAAYQPESEQAVAGASGAAGPGASPGADGAATPPNAGLETVRREFEARMSQLQQEEGGEPQVLQSTPPDGAAVLAQQRAQEQARRDAEMAANRAVQSPDDEILQSTGAAMPPSRAMGLDPAAGSLSAAAALAVDSGAAAQTQQASALAQAAEAAARAPAKKKASERRVTADPATGEIAGGAMATWTDEDLSNAFRSAQAKNVRMQLARELARRRGERDQQAAAPAPATTPTTIQQGSIDGTQADQAQPPRAESSQAAGAQGAPVAGSAAAQELTDGTTSSQHNGAQAGAAPGPQAQAPVQTPAQRIDAGRAAWASMPTAERKALAKRVGGVNAAIKESLHGARWESLNVELQLRLADAMEPQATAPAAAPSPSPGEQQAQAIAKEGNDAQRAQLLAASERWTSMPAAERQAVAAKAKGLNALARASSHTRAWADLAPKVREKLAAAMPDAATAPAGRAPARSVEGRDLGDGWAEFSRDSGSIGVPRAEMPQIRAAHRGAMVNFMNARGIAHQEESVQASSLKPTQAEFSRERVARARGFEGGNRSILVSRDGHVLDGHHQWLAAREAGEDVKVIRLDAPIRELLDAAREFPSSTTSEGAAHAASPASAPATTPKPRGVLAKKAKAEEAARADYFTPGNIVKGYGDSHVRVVSYTPANADGVWSVTVRQVEKQGSGWEDVPGVRERTHATPPSARELKAGPVERTEDLPFRRGEADGQGLTDDQMANLLRIMRPEPAAFSDAARVQAVGQVRETVDAIRKGWSNGPEVVVAFDMNDPAVPEAARRADLRQRSGGASGAPEGFYWKGRAYLLASKLNTPADAARVLHHEVLGHHGLRGMFGPELNKILNQVATMRHAEVAAKVKEYGLRGVTDLSRRHAAEEVLAEMAEKTPQLHIVRRAVAAIRNWLRANVPGFSGLKLTDADIIQGYILPARDFVERGHRAATDRIEPSFSRGAAEMSLVDKARVLQGEPVAVLRGDEAPQGYPLLRAWATKVFKDAGGQAVNPELGAVVLDERAVRDSMAHGMNPFKAAAFAAVPRILERGVVVAEGRANDVQSYFVSAPVQIKGVDDIVTVLVRQDVNSRRMYLHSVITKENLLKARDSGAGAEAPEERSGKVTSGDVASVLRGLLQINTREAAGQDGGEDLMFSRSRLSEIKNSALDQLQKTMSHPGKISVWDKTVGTMRHLAERVPEFKPVYETAQQNIDDVSMLANDAADRAPRLLPRVDTIGALVGKNRKTPVSAADNKAVAKPLFEGTLLWGRDVDGKAVLVDELAKKYGNLPADDKAQLLLRAGRLDDRMLGAWRGLPLAQYEANVNSRFESKMLKPGAVWTDAELQTMFGAKPNQIALYREARAAIDRSIDMTARADMMRALGDEYAGMRDLVLDAPKLSDALELLTTTLQHDAKAKPELADRLLQLNNLVVDRAATAKDLQDAGYAPLSRFGRYTLDVVDQDGNRQYFGMYETMKDTNLAKIQMAQAFPGAVITQGTMSQQSFKLFAGITPETLEIFKDMVVGKEADAATRKVYDEYLKLTKNNHSALKRLIQRKGIEGYSQDVGRVVANFVYSNARQGAAGLNAGTMDRAINDIPKDQGELKDLAMGLRSYIRDPQEEGQAVRGMLFAQYLGGSLASAFVNMTQPFAVTLPWLSQFGGIRAASGQMTRALKDMGTRGMKYETDLAHALKSAEDDGVVSPQEVHQLMAQARGADGLRSGDGTRAGDARAAAGNAWERAKVAWGQPFALAEQFNRRSTFIAAFRIAKAQGMPDPGAFARKAVLETQFVYSKANKPQWARGAVGGTLFTFKTYSVSYLELMQRMWKQGGPEGKRAVGWALAMLLLMGGAGGVPFAEDVEDLIDGAGQLMGYNISSKQWRKQALAGIVGKELGEFMEQGLSGLPGAPIDVSGRLGMGNLIPGTGLFLTKQSRERDLLEVVGPAGDLVARGFTAGRKVLTGDIAGAALEVSPTAVRNLAKGADMAATGMYRDQKGYKVIDTTLAEATAKAIGFQPKSVAEVQEANSFMQRSKSFYTQTSSDIKAQWAQAVFEKDEAGLQRVRDRLADWNKNNPEQPIVVKIPDVAKRVREMNKERTDRIADTSPKALRQQMREMAARLS
ncbi:PLxRFG domain-containing protein [Delftia sp. PE138]|uniref:PLxRFG domain-containing protein n=1 Tax=Delftia sp. PE138 TaxID=1812483 RepID=UPI001BAE58B5|nr:PLxRFG domain-containing protein [Delftia sp. PE138]MBS3721875.1 hypothetical protein [Delftia sp. PE138]